MGGALTGFGFPLLFGGGPGSILGGGIGGTVGGLLGGTQGALGGSIALGAIGQVLDQFLEKSKQLGLALDQCRLALWLRHDAQVADRTACIKVEPDGP